MRGDAVSDPADAAFAVELATNRLERLARFEQTWLWRWLSLRHVVVFAAVGLVLAFALEEWLLLAAAVFTSLYGFGMRIFFVRLRDRIETARVLNERLSG